jgi:hypothetical protein
MRPARSSSVPKWKQAVALMCAAYFLLVWCLPVFMLPFVNLLPFVHERNFWERLLVSSMGSVFVMTLLVTLGPSRGLRAFRSQDASESRWRAVQHWLGLALCFVLATAMSAFVSANLLGAIAHALPGEAYREKVVLESVEFGGSKYKSVNLSYRNPVDNGLRYLVLSKRLFNYPLLSPGDVVELVGQRSAAGFYVSEFRRLQGLTGLQGLPG